MDVTVLIDAIVRQTTVLIAQLATGTGGRATLAHTANQMFVDLVRELKDQGLGNKVIADMFGMALRTYHAKVRRLAESSTFRGQSLWGAVLAFLQEKGTAHQADVLRRFRHDDEATVRGVLSDLVDSGMIFKTGRGVQTTYRSASPDEYPLAQRNDAEIAVNLVWVAVNRFGPATLKALSEVVPLEGEALAAALERLVAEGRVTSSQGTSDVEYDSSTCVIPFETPAGWEAAVFDHYQAVVTAICAKLRRGATYAQADDHVGGSTYGFVIWDGHPHAEEVLGLLGRLRSEAAALRAKVSKYNADHEEPTDRASRVIAYVGQTVIESELAGEKST